MHSWFVRPVPRPAPALRLFCVPFAGVGPSAFRGWAQCLPADVEAMYVHLPGREGRLREQPLSSIPVIVERVADAMAPWLDRPFALFGHSIGGLVVFEVARTLRARGLGAPAALFVSATRAPHVPHPFPPLAHLPVAELLRQVNARYDGSIPLPVLESAELQALLIPALRADLAALETYAHVEQPPLECPISVFGGRVDDTVSSPSLDGWAAHTRTRFCKRLVDGGHLYLQSAVTPLTEAIRDDLAACAAMQPAISGGA